VQVNSPEKPLLEIIFETDRLVAINKPPGLLVHRSPIAGNADEFALQLLRDQLGRRVYPVHRLDRKTSGVLLFALSKSSHAAMHHLIANQQIEKTYHAIVRGYTPDEERIDYPLANETGKVQEAVTNYRTCCRAELAVPFGKFSTSRYSLLEIVPETGRTHQIRRHLSHINHPIIGDRPYGCNKQNKLFLEQWQLSQMMLHASRLSFEEPESGRQCTITASFPPEFVRILIHMGWEDQCKRHNETGLE